MHHLQFGNILFQFELGISCAELAELFYRRYRAGK